MRALVSAVAALPLVLMDAPPNWAQPVCKPTIAFTDAHYAPMKLPKHPTPSMSRPSNGFRT